MEGRALETTELLNEKLVEAQQRSGATPAVLTPPTINLQLVDAAAEIEKAAILAQAILAQAILVQS